MKRIAAVAWPLIGTLVLGLEAAVRFRLGDPFTRETLFWGWFGWLEWIALAPLVVLLAERFPYRPGGRRAFFAVQLVAPFAFSMLHSCIYFTARGQSFVTMWPRRLPAHLTLDLLVYSSTVFATHLALFLRHSWEEERERIALERSIAQAELDALHMQLPPAEIDAQLRAIERTIGEDVMEAERQVMQVSGMLRERLRNGSSGSSGSSEFLGSPVPPRNSEEPEEPRNWADGGLRLRHIAPIVMAAVAVPALSRLAVQSPESLLESSRTVDFLIFFGLALGALAYWRYQLWRRRAIEVEQLDAVLLRTRAKLLRLQLNPHFLFNALNSIAALLEDDREGARTMAARLRHFVDRVLHTSDWQEVPLADELDLISTYVAIENVRFDDRIVLDVDVPQAALDALVPSFLLQPLVENAVRHGLTPSTGGRVCVTASVGNGSLALEVVDNGRGRGSGTITEGIGLSNTRARLHQLYGDRYSLDAEQGAEGFRTLLAIPFRS